MIWPAAPGRWSTFSIQIGLPRKLGTRLPLQLASPSCLRSHKHRQMATLQVGIGADSGDFC